MEQIESREHIFPTVGILPKRETRSEEFLSSNPSYDGRGVVVAIFDSGVDPGAPGLQRTSTGAVKLLDVIDCTGDGDVDMSTVREPEADNTIQGLSGRKLKLSTKWNNPGRTYRVGLLRAYDFFPSELIDRMKRERKKKLFERQQNQLVTQLKRQVEDWGTAADSGIPSATTRVTKPVTDEQEDVVVPPQEIALLMEESLSPLLERQKIEERESEKQKEHEDEELARRLHDLGNGKKPEGDVDVSTSSTDGQQKRKKDLELQLEVLAELEKSVEDPGPLYDCVVFHDGRVWRAAVDTLQNGDLTSQKLLTDYNLEHQYHTFSEMDMMNFAVHIYNEGKILSVVIHSSSHGTHVAGITGAYFPEQPELNGVAPGCQIVSLKIGDQRVLHEETGVGLSRALFAAVRYKCDIINMSYGEPGLKAPSSGRFSTLVSELATKHNIIFVSSASNSGPALSTVGTPGGTHSDILGIGAFIGSDTMTVNYSLREKLPDYMFTWSSRGPALDGWLGVSVCAPGSAASPVPNSTLQGSQMMNGTSMAAPNAAGCVALILSGLKANDITCSPYIMGRALENTAAPVDGAEVFATGCGLLQVPKAYQALVSLLGRDAEEISSRLESEVKYAVNLKTRHGRGLYLREYKETLHPVETLVGVRPLFHPDMDNRKRIQFEKRINLHASQKWIQAPQHMILTGPEKFFRIRVDPTALELGKVHFGEIVGIDSAIPNFGPIFRIPVTIIRPQAMRKGESNSVVGPVNFKPGTIDRRFFVAPKGATSAEVTIKARKLDTKRIFVLHCIQLHPAKTFDEHEYERTFTFSAPDPHPRLIFPVLEETTLEVCLAQNWSSLGETVLEYEISFSGIVSFNRQSIHLNANESIVRVDVKSFLRNEYLQAAASLTKLQRPLRPTSHSIHALLPERDQMPDNGKLIMQLVLNYSFKLEKAVEELCCIVPHLNPLLYDSPLDSQFWLVFDANKRVWAKGDAYPRRYLHKLPKGDYTVRLHFRHDSAEFLEKFKDLVLFIEHKMEEKTTLKVYGTLHNALTDGPALKAKKKIRQSQPVPLYLKVDNTALPGKPGDILVGSLSLRESTKIPLTCAAPIPTTSAAKTPSKEDAETQPSDVSEEQKLQQLLLKQTVDFITQLVKKKQFDKYRQLSASINEQHPGHLPLLQLELHALDSELSPPSSTQKQLGGVVTAADHVINPIDRTKLAVHYGLKLDKEDKAAARERKEMDTQKDMLVDALFRKGGALAQLHKLTQSNATLQQLEGVQSELKKWVDTGDEKYAEMEINLYRAAGLLGHVLKSLRKVLTTPSTSDQTKRKMTELQLEIVGELGWTHWQHILSAAKLVDFPPSYALY